MIEFDCKSLVDLVQNQITLAELEIGTIQLGKNYTCIDLIEIIDIYILDPRVEGYNFETSNFTLSERFARLEELDGVVHLAGGLVCGIENRMIKSFRLTKRYLESLTRFKREDILRFHGNPDCELVDDEMYGGFNYAIDSYILVYGDKNLNFHVDPDTEKLKEITTRKMDTSSLNKRQ